MRCAARAAMDASRASEASDDDDRRDGDADDGVDAFGEVSGVGWSAASGVASQALRGGDVVGPSSGQAAVGPAGHACARMAPTAALPDPKRLPTRLYTCKHAAHSQLGNDRARLQQLAHQCRRAPSLQAAARCCCAARDGVYGTRLEDQSLHTKKRPVRPEQAR